MTESTETPAKKTSKTLKALLACGGLFIVFLIIAALSPKNTPTATGSSTTTAASTETTAQAQASTTEAPATTAAPPTTAAPSETPGQANARKQAAQYLKSQAFSRQGLIDQLSSPYGGKFPVDEATYGVDALNVDWNEQAVKAAQQYLKSQSFSRQGLIDQLSSQYGGKFTVEQATYGVNGAGL